MSKQFFLVGGKSLPQRQAFGPGCQFGVLGDHAQLFLSGKDALSLNIPTLIKVAVKLGYPLWWCVVRSVRAARDVVKKKWFAGSNGIKLMQILDGIVGHGSGQIPFWIA